MTRTYDGRVVVPGLLPDPRAWLGREKDRPKELIADGHFDAFDRARNEGRWASGSWTEAHLATERSIAKTMVAKPMKAVAVAVELIADDVAVSEVVADAAVKP